MKHTMAGLIQQNLENYCRVIGSTSAMSLIEFDDLLMIKIKNPYPKRDQFKYSLKEIFLNLVVRSTFKANIQSRINSIMEEYKATNLPFYWFENELISSDLVEHSLQDIRLHSDVHLPGVAAECRCLPDSFELPEDVHIVKVSNPAELKDWIYPIKEVYGLSELGASLYYQIFCELLQYSPNLFQHYVAYYHDKPFASSSTYFGKYAAGVLNRASIRDKNRPRYKVATEYLIPIELDVAYHKGYQYAVGQTGSESVLKLVHHLGFEQYSCYDAYTA